MARRDRTRGAAGDRRWALRGVALALALVAAWLAWRPSGFVRLRCASRAGCAVTESNLLHHRHGSVSLEGARVEALCAGRAGCSLVVRRPGQTFFVNEHPLVPAASFDAAVRGACELSEGRRATFDVEYGPGLDFYVANAVALALVAGALSLAWKSRRFPLRPSA